MGASAVRKEARARKFGKDEPLANSSAAPNPPLRAGDDSHPEDESHTDAPGKEETEGASNSQKPQRFIVFIGKSPTCPNSLREICSLHESQAIYPSQLRAMQFDGILPRCSRNRSATARTRRRASRKVSLSSNSRVTIG